MMGRMCHGIGAGPSWGGVVNDGRAPRAYSSVKNSEKGVEISI